MHLPLSPLARCSLLTVICACACHPEHHEETVRSSVQEVRAGLDEDSDVVLGVDVLLTDAEGQGIPCEEALVEVSIEVSRNGSDGPWVEVDNGALIPTCDPSKPGDLALVLDNSGSLEEQVEVVRAGARRAAARVQQDGGSISVVRVSTEASIKAPLASQPEVVDEALDNLFVNKGWTALWDGIRMGNETLARSELVSHEVKTHENTQAFCAATRKQGIAIFTDGAENNSAHQKLWDEAYPGDGIDTTLEDLLSLSSEGARTPIYAIGLGDTIDRQALRNLADNSGGRFLELERLDQVDDALETISNYFGTAHRACVEVPSHLCGSLDVRVTHRFGVNAQQDESVSLHHVNVPCAARSNGRVATILLTMDATETGEETVLRLLANTVNWVSPVDAPRVLFVLDDFHHDEFSHDTQKLHRMLIDSGYAAEFVTEPEQGISPNMLEDYDVVWFSNPGYPMDDEQSFNALLQFSEAGGGVVLQGDDMSYSFGKAFPTTPLTRLKSIDNGTRYCGVAIDNLKGGRYRVQFNQASHPVIAGLETESLLYGDDIDITEPIDERTEVLAWAAPEGAASDCALTPVVTAFDPAK